MAMNIGVFITFSSGTVTGAPSVMPPSEEKI